MTGDEIEERGWGQLRPTPFLLYGLTFAEIGNAMAGHYKEIEEREKAEWERTRWLGSMIMQPHLKKGRKLQPKDLMQFPWEKPKAKAEKLTKEELRQRILERDQWQS